MDTIIVVSELTIGHGGEGGQAQTTECVSEHLSLSLEKNVILVKESTSLFCIAYVLVDKHIGRN